MLAAGGELAPITDDRQAPTIVARRARLNAQVDSLMGNASTALVVGGGLSGVELAAELAEKLGPGKVTLAVGPTLPTRGSYPGDPGAGLLPGFRDTCDMPLANLGRGGATRYARKWLEKKGVRILKAWAVPPPPDSTLGPRALVPGATLRTPTAMAAPPCARAWRDVGVGVTSDDSWAVAGPKADLPADVVFDCRGIRPNTRQTWTRFVDANERVSGRQRARSFGLPPGVVGGGGWLRVDERFRLSQSLPGGSLYREPVYDGRVYCVGDAAEKDKVERTAANAHAEGEYAALDIRRAVRGQPPLPPYVAPPRLCAISLGKNDGLVVLGAWVALRGWLAALVKRFLQWYFVNFLPLPYWLMRRLPFRTDRQYGGTLGAPRGVQLARSGARGVARYSGVDDGTDSDGRGLDNKLYSTRNPRQVALDTRRMPPPPPPSAPPPPAATADGADDGAAADGPPRRFASVASLPGMQTFNALVETVGAAGSRTGQGDDAETPAVLSDEVRALRRPPRPPTHHRPPPSPAAGVPGPRAAGGARRAGAGQRASDLHRHRHRRVRGATSRRRCGRRSPTTKGWRPSSPTSSRTRCSTLCRSRARASARWARRSSRRGSRSPRRRRSTCASTATASRTRWRPTTSATRRATAPSRRPIRRRSARRRRSSRCSGTSSRGPTASRRCRTATSRCRASAAPATSASTRACGGCSRCPGARRRGSRRCASRTRSSSRRARVPVALLEGRIASALGENLEAIRNYVKSEDTCSVVD